MNTPEWLLAQKLANSLVLEPIQSRTMPYLMVKAVDDNLNASNKATEKLDELDWVNDFFFKNNPDDPRAALETARVVFDSVKRYDVSYKGKITEHKMFSGASIADNLTKQNPEYKMTAYISRTSTFSSHSVPATVETLQNAFDYGLPVYMYLPDLTSIDSYNVALSGTETSNNTNAQDIYGFITSLKITRDDTIQDGFKIDMTIKQTRFYETLNEGEYVFLKDEAKDSGSSKENGGRARVGFYGECNKITNDALSLLFSASDAVKYGRSAVFSPYKEELEQELIAVRDKFKDQKSVESCDVEALVWHYETQVAREQAWSGYINEPFDKRDPNG